MTGSKVPTSESIIPSPLKIPPDGLAIKLPGLSLKQNGPPDKVITGISKTSTSTDALLSHPFSSVKK